MVKSLFKKIEENKLLPFLFFLLVSCCMWLLQTLNHKYETDVAFRVNVEELPSDIELDKEDTYFMVRVRDVGTTLIGYEIKGAIPLKVSYNELVCINGRLVLPLHAAMKKIENVIGSSGSIVRLLQDTLVIDVKRDVALLPVRLNGVIDAADHYMVTDVEIVPSEVNVYATAADLENINEVKTEHLVKKYLKSGMSFKANLVAGDMMTIEPSVVDVHVSVQHIVEKKVNVPIEYISFPDGYAGMLPGEVELSFEAPESDVESIGAKDFKVYIDYREVISSGTGTGNFTILPSSHKVVNVKANPSQITIR